MQCVDGFSLLYKQRYTGADAENSERGPGKSHFADLEKGAKSVAGFSPSRQFTKSRTELSELGSVT